jgi:predicted Zn-dependent protease
MSVPKRVRRQNTFTHVMKTFLFPSLRRRLRTCALVLTASASCAAFAASEPSFITGQKKSYAYSWQEEVQQGAEGDKEVVEEMGLYDNPQLQSYIESLGQKLVQVSNFTSANAPEIYRNTKFTFRIIDSTTVNAFALPGGYVYVTRGLLAHVENEAQLAVVLGHEIGHVVARHASQQARRNQFGQIGVVLGSILGQKILGEKMPNIGSTILTAGSKATETFLLKYSREAETEADTLGVTFASRANYAAGESARFFQALQQISASEGQALPTWESTHPDPGDRARHVTELAAANQPRGSRPIVGEQEYLRQIDGIVVGDDPREGFAQNGIFYQPEMHFQMPIAPGWKMDNQKSAVTFSEPNGKAAMGLKLAAGVQNARDAAQQFVQKSGVQVVTNGNTTINGLPTTVVIGQKNTDQGAVEVWDAFIEMEGRVYSVLGYAPQNTFEEFRPTFESTAAGFSPLHQNIDVQPTHLRIVRADRSGPFTSFIPTSLPQNLSAESIAIMNQRALNDQVNAGQLLKVPETPPANNFSATNQPAANSYPDRRGEDPYRGDYPNQSRYPQNDPRYPRRDYPPQSQYPNPNYPSSQPYPQTSSGYPNSNGYPQNPSYPSSPNYPQSSSGYPSTNYPNNGYPQSNYPNNSYPGQNYPNQPYPNTSGPQFPQPPGTNSQPNQPTQPSWPR